RREVAGEVVEESAKVGPRRVRRERLEAVDDDDPGTALLEEGADPLGHPVQAMLVEDCAEIVVEDRAADRFRIEEAERLAVAEDLVERLRHRGEVDGGPLGRRVGKDVLLREDRLAGTRQPDHHVDRVRPEAAAEHRIEVRLAAREPIVHPDVAPCTTARAPTRPLTVGTNRRASSGFWSKASATPATAASPATRPGT